MLNKEHAQDAYMSDQALRIRERIGQSVEILSPLDPNTYDIEDTGVIYVIKFADGHEGEAFADELTFV